MEGELIMALASLFGSSGEVVRARARAREALEDLLKFDPRELTDLAVHAQKCDARQKYIIASQDMADARLSELTFNMRVVLAVALGIAIYLLGKGFLPASILTSLPF